MTRLSAASLLLALWSLACGSASSAEEAVDAKPAGPDVPPRTTCIEGAPCATCDPAGTGTQVGDIIADTSWRRDDGTDLSLHSYCGVKKGVLIIETASWCTLCTERLPLMQQWIAQYEPLGIQFIFLVGENKDAQPPTQANLEAYRADHTLQTSLEVIGDPKWIGIKKAVLHPGGVGSLPAFILLDASMKLLYVGDGGDKALFPQVPDALEKLTGSAFVATTKCAGFCGKLAPGGCWCDDLCATLGNCCPDNCGVCGFCE